MGFVNPMFLWFSLFIIAVIIMYFFRKRYAERTVSSNLLWNEVMQEWQASPWLRKLQKNLLLFLQIVILAFIIVALMKPYLEEDQSYENVIILIDVSASMSNMIDEQSRFEIVKSQVHELMNRSNQKYTVMTVGESTTILADKEAPSRAFYSKLEGLKLSYEHEDFTKAIRLALAKAKGTSSTIHIYSDSFSREQLSQFDPEVSVHVHNLEQEAHNISLKSFGIAAEGDLVKAVAVVENQTKQKQSGLFSISSEGETLFKQSIEVGSGEEIVLPIDSLPSKPIYLGEIQFEDSYNIDNEIVAVNQTDYKTIYAVGKINPFVIKGFKAIGANVVSVSKEEGKKVQGVMVLSSEDFGDHINNPALILPNSQEEAATPLTQTIQKSQDPLLSHVPVEKIYVTESTPQILQGLEVVASSDTPLIQKGVYGSNSVVAMNFKMENSDWPLHSSFPIFLYNTFSYLTEGIHFLGYFEPNEQRWLNQANTTSEDKWDLYTTGGTYISSWLESESFTAPSTPGAYQAVKEDETLYFSVQLDEREKSIENIKSFTIEREEKQNSLVPNLLSISKWFILLAILLLFVELEVFRRGHRA